MPETPRESFITANDTRFHVLEWGAPDSPPVVLHHGLASNAHSWDRIAPALTPKYRAIAYDSRNHGDSDRGGFGSWAYLAADLTTIVDVLELDRFTLIGHSAGGGAAINYAGTNPGRLIRLVLIDIGPEPPGNKRTGPRLRRRVGQFEFDSLEALVSWVRRPRQYADEDWIVDQARKASEPLPDGRYRLKFNSTEIPDTGERVDLWPLLPKIDCPTLILRAEESGFLDLEEAAKMVEMIPDSRATSIPRAGHLAHEDNPEAVLAALLPFFDIEA